MPHTVAVTIEVEPAAAATLDDPVTRGRIERLVSRTLRHTTVEQRIEVMDAISDEARRRGLNG